MIATQDEWLTPKAIAERLAVSRDTVRGWIERGELKALLVSTSPSPRKRRYRVRASDLDTFVDARTAAARPAPKPKARRRRPAYERIV